MFEKQWSVYGTFRCHSDTAADQLKDHDLDRELCIMCAYTQEREWEFAHAPGNAATITKEISGRGSGEVLYKVTTCMFPTRLSGIVQLDEPPQPSHVHLVFPA